MNVQPRETRRLMTRNRLQAIEAIIYRSYWSPLARFNFPAYMGVIITAYTAFGVFDPARWLSPVSVFLCLNEWQRIVVSMVCAAVCVWAYIRPRWGQWFALTIGVGSLLWESVGQGVARGVFVWGIFYLLGIIYCVRDEAEIRLTEQRVKRKVG